MLSRKSRITTLTVLVVLAFSTIVPALAYAAPLANNGKDWQYVNGNSWAQNNSPQTQINKGNVDQLEAKWIFPLESGSVSTPQWLVNLLVGEGSTTPPIVVNGVVYFTSTAMKTYAVDANTGRMLWKYQYTVDIEKVKQRLPLIVPRATHFHGIRYWSSQDVLLVPGAECNFIAIDAKTGKEKFQVGPTCIDVPGSKYPYEIFTTMMGTTVLGTYEKERLFIGGSGGNERGADSGYRVGRGMVWAVDMDNPSKVVWRVFNQPPQDKPVNDWALQDCDKGWFYTIPCSEVKTKAPQNLMNDWQIVPGEVPHWSSSVTAMWGQPVVDEDTGFLYLNTGNIMPYFYTDYRPGPNLYGSTIQAIDMNKGQRAWWVQDAPRDPWDYDCNWSGFLADDPKLGKVYVKGCKLGFLHVRDALTGKPIHYIDTRAEGQYDPRMGSLMRGGVRSEGGVGPAKGGLLGVEKPLNPLSESDMKKLALRDQYPDGTWITINPPIGHGSFGSSPSYHDGTIFHYVQTGLATNKLQWLWPRDPSTLPEVAPYTPSPLYVSSGPVNATLVARDLVTGNVKWMYFYPYTNVRAFPTVTGGMVILPHPDGKMRLIDESNGKLLREINLGGTMLIGATVGQDSAGNSKIFVLVGAAVGAQGSIPGNLVAIGLSDRAAAEVKTTTVTTTQSTTVTTTSATTSTVTTTSATTATTTLTSTQPAKTTTVTSEITQTSGLPSEITYAVAAVAVIAIIAAAFLAMRKK